MNPPTRLVHRHAPSIAQKGSNVNDRLGDAELMRRIRDLDDKAAFTALVRRHSSGLVSRACRRGLDAEEAADLANEVLFAVWAQRQRWKPGRRFSGYLNGIAKRKIIDRLRQRKVAPGPVAGLPGPGGNPVAGVDLGTCALRALFAPPPAITLCQWQLIVAAYYYTYSPKLRRFTFASFNRELLPFLETAPGLLGGAAAPAKPPWQFAGELAQQFLDHLSARGRRPAGAPSVDDLALALDLPKTRVRVAISDYTACVVDCVLGKPRPGGRP